MVEEEEERERLKKLKEQEGDGSGAAAGGERVAVPSEEEVEEFFAILKRMRVAVKYFDEKGRGGKEWREALEEAAVTVEDGGNADDVGGNEVGVVKKKDAEVINEVLDLNEAAPEAAESGGS